MYMKRGILLIAAATLTSQMMASVSFGRDHNCRDMEKSAAKGAIIGGIIGAVVGNNVGNHRTDGHDVATGAVLGGLTGAALDSENCIDDRGVTIVYRDYPDNPHRRHGDWGRDRDRDRWPDQRQEQVISRYEFDRDFMNSFSRTYDSYEQRRAVRDFSDRLQRYREKIDGRMLYDILLQIDRTNGRRMGDQPKLDALMDLQYATARLLPREASDLRSFFRGRSSYEADRILSRM
jgi:hypothetical protein